MKRRYYYTASGIMRYILYSILLATTVVVVLFSCKKWTDPAAVNDPRLTNPYCNDPNAVNYNWGFPGRPDDSLCFYPVDLFRGTYIFQDSIFLLNGTYVFTRLDTLHLYALSQTKLAVLGFCPIGDTMHLTAGPTYIATVDTTLGDSTFVNRGQLLCRIQDTVSGTITKDRIDTTLLHISLQVVSDTGITVHSGTGIKQ